MLTILLLWSRGPLASKEELLIAMNALSRKYFGCQWAKDLEFLLHLQLGGFRFEGLVSISKLEEQNLRRLTQATQGWYLWDEKCGHPVFVSWGRWYPIYNEWHFTNILFTVKVKSDV